MSFVRPGGATRVRADTQHKIRLQCEDFKRWTEMNPNHWRSAWSILKWPQKHVQIVQVAIIVVRIKSDNFSWRQEFCAIFAVFSDFSLPFLLSQLLLLDCFLLQALKSSTYRRTFSWNRNVLIDPKVGLCGRMCTSSFLRCFGLSARFFASSSLSSPPSTWDSHGQPKTFATVCFVYAHQRIGANMKFK